MGPLTRDSINESLNWIQKHPQPIEVVKQNMVAAIAEWALHDKETFAFWSGKICRVALDELNYPVPIYPYEWYVNTLLWGDYFKEFPMLSYV